MENTRNFCVILAGGRGRRLWPQMDRVLGFKDPVLCDAYVCDCMGYTIDDVPYIGMAERLGIGCADTSKAEVIYLNKAEGGAAKFPMTRKVRGLATYTAPKDACSACYGSLIHALNRMSEEGTLRHNGAKIAIGQGYKGESGELGIGQCTACFAKSLRGCPPKANEILAFLEENW